MQRIKFTKTVASGNDFVVIEASKKLQTTNYRSLARKICNRKYGLGADGLLLLEKSKKADVKMRIFNADGSEAKMCGNGARCVALYISHRVTRSQSHKCEVKIQTKAGVIESSVNKDNVKIKLIEPKDIKLDVPVRINNRLLKINFVNTGVPHAVIFTEGVEKLDVLTLGRILRFHKKFKPEGANVDFIEAVDRNSIKLRTYERGVEAETLACGTGAVASAIIFSLKVKTNNKIDVLTRSNQVLKVHFKKFADKFRDVWLEGKAEIISKGEYYV